MWFLPTKSKLASSEVKSLDRLKKESESLHTTSVFTAENSSVSTEQKEGDKKGLPPNFKSWFQNKTQINSTTLKYNVLYCSTREIALHIGYLGPYRNLNKGQINKHCSSSNIWGKTELLSEPKPWRWKLLRDLWEETYKSLSATLDLKAI